MQTLFRHAILKVNIRKRHPGLSEMDTAENRKQTNKTRGEEGDKIDLFSFIRLDWSRGPKWVNNTKLTTKSKEWSTIAAPVTAIIFPQIRIFIFIYMLRVLASEVKYPCYIYLITSCTNFL